MDTLRKETVVEDGTEYEITQYTEDGKTVYATVKFQQLYTAVLPLVFRILSPGEFFVLLS